MHASSLRFNVAFDVMHAPTCAPARLKVFVAATHVIRRSAISGAAEICRRVLRTVEDEIAMDLVGNQD
jgi:hypothetical protein